MFLHKSLNTYWIAISPSHVKILLGFLFFPLSPASYNNINLCSIPCIPLPSILPSFRSSGDLLFFPTLFQ